ncbi:MAG: glycogen synthase GlgA [Candidatus Omnitrophota bacterium]|jgi:starch synthase
MKKRSKKVLFTASEAVPFIKTGGLGDVCGTLPKALRKLGYDVRLVLPRYWAISKSGPSVKWAVSPMGVPMGNCQVWCGVLETESDGMPVYFVDHEDYFGRAGLYDDGIRAYDDNADRFGFFSRACLQLCRDLKFRPDIVHAHDWQTALVPCFLKIQEWNDPFFAKTASVFSIHNMAHQGVFPVRHYPFLGLGNENFVDDKFENYGGINFMKGAVFYSDAITTVSPSYAKEILTHPGGSGLAPYLERRRDDLSGVLNGADYDHWNPSADPLIAANYSPSDLSGKAVCKKELQREFMLDPDPRVPVIGIISRFCHQKGFQLLAPVIRAILRNMVVQFVFLGSGEKSQEDFFGGLPAAYPGRVGAWIGYDNRKAHWIEAGADFLLMPSLYEPCGLNQIYSMGYGTLPIVRETGGLKDTVQQYNEHDGTGTGFVFFSPDPMAIYYTVGWAVSTYYDRPNHIARMRDQAMHERFTWDDSAKHYETVYEKALARRALWK